MKLPNEGVEFVDTAGSAIVSFVTTSSVFCQDISKAQIVDMQLLVVLTLVLGRCSS